MTSTADRLSTEVPSAPIRRRTSLLFGAGSGLLICGLLAYWGGSVRSGPLFVFGLVVLSIMIIAAGAVLWWLYASPLRTQESAAQQPNAALRQVVVLAAVIGGLFLVVAAFWDTVWHRRYGLGAVLNDFFWRPHELIYGGMALLGGFAIVALLLMLRGRGGLRERFRAEPLVGVLGVIAAYLGLSGPSDLVWHRLYGLDLTAWSLPHLMLAGLLGLVMLLAVAITLTVASTIEWRGLGRRPRAHEALCALLIALGSVGIAMVLLSDYEGRPAPGTTPTVSPSLAVVWARPEWLYPVVLAGLGTLLAAIAVNALRRAGAATAVVLVILTLRAVLFGVFGLWSEPLGMSFAAWVLLLPPAVATDVWYAARLRHADTGRTAALGGLIAGAACAVVALPVIAAGMEYPRVNWHTAPAMVLGSLVIGTWGGWVGAGIGRWLARLGAGERQVRADPRVGRFAAVAVVAAVAFLAFFVVTAQPPASPCRDAGPLCLIRPAG
jgi:hypothetical protein